MKSSMLIAAAVVIAPIWIAMRSVKAGPPKPEPRGRAVVPDALTEGPRDLEKAVPPLRAFVVGQPFGKSWKDLVKVEPAPKDKTALGTAETHAALKNDPIEMQTQVQFLEETGTEVRYGFASIRGLRVYRYGKLASVQLVVDMVGKPERDRFKQDVEALAAAWSDPIGAFDLKGSFLVVRNDLFEQKKLRPLEFPVAPLRIELKPKDRGEP